VVGCGNISLAYLRNARLFAGVRIVACADLKPQAAEEKADAFGLQALDCDRLVRSPDVDLILNLTVPSAHFEISKQALDAGKHVFTEKPLSATAREGRMLVETAARRGLTIGSAPDTFLGAAGRHARRLIEGGTIGTPVLGTAF